MIESYNLLYRVKEIETTELPACYNKVSLVTMVMQV